MKPSPVRQSFQRSLREAGCRWRNRFALQGLLIVIAGLSLASAIAIPFMDASHFAPATVATARTFVYVLLAVLTLMFLVVRVPRSRDRWRLVEHLEVQAQERETLLLTAVQMDTDDADAPLEQRLYQRAAAACDDPHGNTREDRSALRRATAALLVLAGIVTITVFMLGEGQRHGMKLLLEPWRDAQDGMPYKITAQPGDTALRERADIAISGSTRGFVPQILTLVHRVKGESGWSRTPMRAATLSAALAAGASDDEAPLGAEFSAQLLVVAAPFEYYLEGDNVRSRVHKVEVKWLPRVARIDHIYHYPRYTGVAERHVESATDIAAVTGTSVQVRVLPQVAAGDRQSVASVRGELVLDDSTRRELVADGEMLTASLSVDEASRYRIELLAEDAEDDLGMVRVTADHAINALADGAPLVTLAQPASDTRVTAVEEIAVQVRADDDVSLRQVELLYSINGEPEEVVALAPNTVPASAVSAATAPASVVATHTLYLEENGLRPGDMVSYYARASDGVVSRTSVTDIQFMEVRPFDRDYRRGRAGGRGGGAGGRNDEGLAAQQRDLVVALFRLARDAQQLPDEEQAQRLTTLSDAQRRIRERVEAIVRRLKGRAVVQDTPGYALMLEVMPKAIAAMARVEALLAVPDADESLPSAREALAHLQRADAAFREVQVASRQGGGGGGGGRAGNNDLSRLFELEMDRFRNRYSQVQRAQSPQRRRQQEVDESLEKLKQLARRQREEIERARRRAARPQGNDASTGTGSGDAAGGAATQQALAKALAELLRQLERLSREQPGAAVDAARQALQQAAQSMQPPQPASRPRAGSRTGNQRGSNPGSSSGSARQGSGSESTGDVQAASEALERLNAARRALAGDGDDQMSRAVQQAQQRAESLVRRQARIATRLQGAVESASTTAADGSADGAQSARLAQAQADGPDNNSARAGVATTRQIPRADLAGNEAVPREGDGGQHDDGVDQGRSIDELKAAMQADALQLREQLDRIASSSELDSRVRDPARQAGAVMREEDIEGRLRYSREQLAAGQSTETLESSLAEALDRVREQVAQSAGAVAQSGESHGARNGNQNAGSNRGRRGAPGVGDARMPSAQRLREMMRELAGLRDRIADRGRGSAGAGPGGRSRDDLRDLAGDLDRLGGRVGDRAFGPLASNSDRAGDLRLLVERIEALAGQDNVPGGQAGDTFLAALANVERLLKAEAEAGQDAVPTGRDARMPREYRALIEAYFRRLSGTEERAQP